MSSFSKLYTLSSTAPEPKHRLASIANEPWNQVSAGTYNDGEITILHDGFNASFMQSWIWLVGNHAYALAVLSWGDFVYLDTSEKNFYIVLVKDFQKVSMGNTLKGVFNGNFCSSKFRDVIIKPNEVAEYVDSKGSVPYGKILHRKPGKEKFISAANLDVRLDVLGQTARQLKNRN